jgi:tetratricopeptide (TPR) repeat protein
MIKKQIASLLVTAVLAIPVFSQPTQAITDPEKKYKQVKEFMLMEQYALAYPLLAELKEQYPNNTGSDHAYINDDVNFYYIVCELKLQQPIAEQEAKQYIDVVNNEPRRQMLSYQLAKFYFMKEDFSSALAYYEKAGLDNLTNAEIADAKFEKGYCYFNLKQFDKAKPLFEEITQLDDNKYFIPANYYYGYICFGDRQYNQALHAFKLVETRQEYKGVVPYYIAEIYYLQGKKEEALRYGESVLSRNGFLQYQKEMNGLMGQLYFEKKNYQKALPLLEAYVSSTDKVSKEILYEMSYCYYDGNLLSKAIEGFKQLSNETDSMGQNSMYLLGDCYLRTHQKANARNAFQYCAYNSSNKKQQQVSRFNYAKLSYELGYQDIALNEMKKYLADYPGSEYDTEAKEILVGLLANTSNFVDALQLYESFDKPTASMQKVYSRILYGRAVELINDQQTAKADELLTKQLQLPPSKLTPYAYFWKGEIAYRNKYYDSAVRYLNFYLENNAPELGEANAKTAKYDLGYCWLQKEFYPKALGYFEQVTKTVSSTSPFIEIDAYVRSADCYFMNKEYDKANTMYDYLLNIAHIESDYAWYQKAIIAGIKNPGEKIKTLNTLVHLYPNSSMSPDVNMEIANTYMADEKFREAIPYLNNVLNAPDAGGIKPAAYLKLGLSYYNSSQNAQALSNYQLLMQKYPQSPEADEALENIKNIYVEEGKPNEYLELMKSNGKNVSASEADSLTYIAAELKYTANDYPAAIAGFTNYLSHYPEGAHALDANYFMAECYDKNKDWTNALPGYEYVNAKGLNRYFERSTLEAARISYFELKDYATAKKYFESLRQGAVSQDNQLEALRGLVRCYYQLKDYAQANDAAKDLSAKKGISTDDRSIAFLVLGKSLQLNNNCAEAITAFRSCAAINKTAWGAEARYEIANCQYSMGNFAIAEKSALAVIKETGSYDNWVTRSYILLGDIFMQQKDYFNAKATYESVAKNAVIPELKQEAQQKLDKAIAEEKSTSKVN